VKRGFGLADRVESKAFNLQLSKLKNGKIKKLGIESEHDIQGQKKCEAPGRNLLTFVMRRWSATLITFSKVKNRDFKFFNRFKLVFCELQ
jgi:hypothetical protein